MPKWLSRTLLVVLVLAVITGALVGAFYMGQKVGITNAAISDPSEFSPRLDRDQVKPSLRDDDSFNFPWMHMPSRTFAFSRFPVLGMLFAAVWALARLGLLVLLIWLIVRFTLRSTKPVPAAPTTPADHAPDTSAPEN